MIRERILEFLAIAFTLAVTMAPLWLFPAEW